MAKVIGQQGQPGLDIPSVAIPFEEPLDRARVAKVMEPRPAVTSGSAQTDPASQEQKGGAQHLVGAGTASLVEEERRLGILRPAMPCPLLEIATYGLMYTGPERYQA